MEEYLDNDKREDDPSEEEIKSICESIRKSWSNNQKQSRAVCKIKDYTVSVIRTNDIEGDYNY